jgi:hypothetical protein
MTAPDLETLLDIPTNLENDFFSYFQVLGIDMLGTGDADTVTENTISLQVIQGGAQGHKLKHTVTGTGEAEEDWFNCSLGINVSTEQGGNHSLRVNSIKKSMLYGSINGKVPGNPGMESNYYFLNQISFGGQSEAVNEMGSLTTNLSYNLLVCIRPEAWCGLNN